MWEVWCKNNVLCVNILFALANFMTLTAQCIKLKSQNDCKSRNVVYGVFWKKSNKIVYVGETGLTLNQRRVKFNND